MRTCPQVKHATQTRTRMQQSPAQLQQPNKKSGTYRIVNAHGTIVAGGNRPAVFQGKFARDGQKDDIAFPGRGHVKEFDRDLTVFRRDGRSGTPGTAKNAQGFYGKLACLEALADFLANGPRRTDNADRQGHAQGAVATAEGRETRRGLVRQTAAKTESGRVGIHTATDKGRGGTRRKGCRTGKAGRHRNGRREGIGSPLH